MRHLKREIHRLLLPQSRKHIVVRRRQNDIVFAGVGEKQTVNFTLQVAHSNQTVEVSGIAPLINPENPNTSTNLNVPALENLPNPGGDLTYPLQFAAGALVNTAGSGNDFV